MTLKTDVEIVNEAPEQAVTYCMYDYCDAMEGNYLNCENQFFDQDQNNWVDMDLVENYFHSHRRITDIKKVINISKANMVITELYDSGCLDLEREKIVQDYLNT